MTISLSSFIRLLHSVATERMIAAEKEALLAALQVLSGQTPSAPQRELEEAARREQARVTRIEKAMGRRDLDTA